MHCGFIAYQRCFDFSGSHFEREKGSSRVHGTYFDRTTYSRSRGRSRTHKHLSRRIWESDEFIVCLLNSPNSSTIVGSELCCLRGNACHVSSFFKMTLWKFEIPYGLDKIVLCAWSMKKIDLNGSLLITHHYLIEQRDNVRRIGHQSIEGNAGIKTRMHEHSRD